MVKTNLFSDVASVEQYIATYPVANALYNSFRPDWKILVQDFFLSKRTLPLTYDPFFKRIFNADTHPDRLSRLISSILGQEVTVTEILSNEDTLLKGSLLPQWKYKNCQQHFQPNECLVILLIYCYVSMNRLKID